MENIKLIITIQCEIAKRRCSGFHCMNSFFTRTGLFKDYPKNEELRFLTFQCGGCHGKGINSLLGTVNKLLAKENLISKDEVAVHFASCVAFDNHHSDRCPFINAMKKIVNKMGYINIVEGSYLSKTATRRREEGVYKDYISLNK